MRERVNCKYNIYYFRQRFTGPVKVYVNGGDVVVFYVPFIVEFLEIQESVAQVRRMKG